ncbi:Origin recognition complex subunit 3, partial [Coemansia sp. 'formosensis']
PAISVSLSQAVSREILSHVGAHAVYRFVIEGRKSGQPVALINVVGWNAEIRARAMSSTLADNLPDISGRCIKILFTHKKASTFDTQARQWLEDNATELISLLDADADSLLHSRKIPIKERERMVDAYKPMDAFDSMTESTFILKPSFTPKQSTTKKASVSHPPAFNNGGFVPLFQGKEAEESMELRRKLFSEMWGPLEQLLVDTEEQVNQVGVSEVCNYVNCSYTRIESVEKGQLDQPFAEMATAVAFAGVNTGDHSKLFESLQAQLTAGGHHVALLESQYCTSLASMLKCMLDQILGSLDEVQRPTGNSRSGVLAGAKTIAYDMGLLKLRWDEA